MPRRNVAFADGEYYHVFNRGVARIPIFYGKRDYTRFLKATQYYINNPRGKGFSHIGEVQELAKLPVNVKEVDIISYCLMLNHFHFLLRQKEEGGISNFMRKLMNSHAKYFNVKHEREGPLYQGNFKAVWIESTEQLIHVDRYIHLNPVVSQMKINMPEEYEWSSYNEHLGSSSRNICNREIIKEQFKTVELFKSFTTDHIDYAKKLESMKHLLLDSNVQPYSTSEVDQDDTLEFIS